jgi:hypothetical protein
MPIVLSVICDFMIMKCERNLSVKTPVNAAGDADQSLTSPTLVGFLGKLGSYLTPGPELT